MTGSALIGRSAEETTVSEEVISAVAAAKGTDPLDLDPLNDVLDPDALDSLCGDETGRSRSPDRIEFTYSGCEVVVAGDGSVSVSTTPEDAR